MWQRRVILPVNTDVIKLFSHRLEASLILFVQCSLIQLHAYLFLSSAHREVEQMEDKVWKMGVKSGGWRVESGGWRVVDGEGGG